MPKPELAIPFAIVVLASSACSVVRHSTVRDDYDAADKRETVRLVAVASPSPGGDEKLAMLVAKIAQRYANHHRDFVVKAARTATSTDSRCADDMQGVLQIAMTLERDGDEVRADAELELVRCRDGTQVWSAGGGGSWPTADPQISQVIALYKEEFGDEVVGYVPAAFHLLRALLDTLPTPELVSDDLVMEKIELED